jgi:hypothetical protein
MQFGLLNSLEAKLCQQNEYERNVHFSTSYIKKNYIAKPKVIDKGGSVAPKGFMKAPKLTHIHTEKNTHY